MKQLLLLSALLAFFSCGKKGIIDISLGESNRSGDNKPTAYIVHTACDYYRNYCEDYYSDNTIRCYYTQYNGDKYYVQCQARY